MSIALVQINATVGALEQNADRITRRAQEAFEAGARVIAFPELALSGYPPEDLVLKRHFVDNCEHQLERLIALLPEEAVVVVGSPLLAGDAVYNSAVLFHGSGIIGTYRKRALPNYGVFDEKRLFATGERALVLDADGCRVGIHICEDSWEHGTSACTDLQHIGLDALLNLSASPYHRRKWRQREEILRSTAACVEAPLLYCNLVGGQDELVFDGASMAVRPDGSVMARAKQFEEDILLVSLPVPEARKPTDLRGAQVVQAETATTGTAPTPRVEPMLDDVEEVYAALELGVHDYVDKNGFDKVVVAISGGIDSALVAAVAVDALGSDRVAGVTMPSQYSSEDTLSDAGALARNLGIEFHTVAIKPLYEAYTSELAPLWPDRGPDVTEENLQARIRGNIVMALSNKFGWLVLATGNKSELATGYCTLYGDMVGGFAAIKDVPKTLVFELCRWRNEARGPVIPESIITRPPSAELRADQKDTDSLPPYDVLDPILERYVERDMGIQDIVSDGFDEKTVGRVVRLADRSEYKRRQGPPGIKITPKAFGRDRRMPITNRYGG